MTLQQFEDRIASDTPTPGGGALAAVTVSFAGALLQMCLAITEKKRPCAAVAALKERTKELLALCRGTADEDIAAFDSYVAARRLPKADEEEKTARDAARHSALIEAARVPLEAAGRALDLAEVAIQAEREVSAVVLSDLGTSVEFLRAAAKSLLLNVETNMRGLKPMEDEDAQPLFDVYAEVSARHSRLDRSLTLTLVQIARRAREG
ncbi:MAG: cyclodeaminase/cyclohydrolase family protein [Bryobacteraceae bacterium]